MNLALLNIDGSLARYPYTIEDLRADNPGWMFFPPIDADTLAHYNVVAVQASTAPVPDVWQTLEEIDPAFIDGVLTQQWALIEVEPDVLAQRMADSEAALVKGFTAALERYYDLTAAERQYDNRLTCALRAGYPGPFQPEGTAFAVWMDECNAYAYGVLAAVKSGQRTMPASPDALIAELPALVWP